MCYNKTKSIRKLNIKVICGIYTNRDSKLPLTYHNFILNNSLKFMIKI